MGDPNSCSVEGVIARANNFISGRSEHDVPRVLIEDLLDCLIETKEKLVQLGLDTHSLQEQLIETRRQTNCDVCTGTGELGYDGPLCVCGGTGKNGDAVVYLREQLQKKEKIIRKALAAAEAERELRLAIEEEGK